MKRNIIIVSVVVLLVICTGILISQDSHTNDTANRTTSEVSTNKGSKDTGGSNTTAKGNSDAQNQDTKPNNTNNKANNNTNNSANDNAINKANNDANNSSGNNSGNDSSTNTNNNNNDSNTSSNNGSTRTNPGNVFFSDIKASIDPNTKKVTISGVLSSGEGKRVSVIVTAPDGNVDFLYQTTSTGGGKFDVNYVSESTIHGTYVIKLGAVGLKEHFQTTFVY